MNSVTQTLFILIFFFSSLAFADSRCEIFEDQQRIFHMEVESESQGYYCMGFVHGETRAYQMDILLRIALGKQAEVFGFSKIKDDFFMRTLGLSAHAERIFNGLNSESKEILQQYSQGIQEGTKKFLSEKRDSPFQSYSYRPLAFEAKHVILLLLLQSFDQSKHSFVSELIPEKKTPSQKPWEISLLKKSAPSSQEEQQSSIPRSPKNDNLYTTLPETWKSDERVGSNSFALPKNKSKSGNAWFANDPHLASLHPAFWQILHLKTKTYDVIGAMLPGTGVFASATNLHTAWGLTTSYADTADLVPLDSSKVSLQSVRPLLWVRVGKIKLPFFFKTFQTTEDGIPVFPLDVNGKKHLLYWSGFELESKDIEELFSLPESKSSKEIIQKISRVGLPSWNFTSVDLSGRIEYLMNGKIPNLAFTEEKTEKNWDQRKKTSFWISESVRPKKSTQSEILVSANHSPYSDLKRGYPESYRAFTLEEKLKKSKSWSKETLATLQCSTTSSRAQFLVPALLSVHSFDQAWDEWDGEFDSTCTSCVSFLRFLDHMKEHGYSEAELWDKIQSKDENLLKKEIPAAWNQVKTDLGQNLTKPWGEMIRAYYPWMGSMDKGDQYLFAEGDDSTPSPSGPKWNQNGYYEQTHQASYRMVVELSSPPKVYLALHGPNQWSNKSELMETDSPWKQFKNCLLQKAYFPMQK